MDKELEGGAAEGEGPKKKKKREKPPLKVPFANKGQVEALPTLGGGGLGGFKGNSYGQEDDSDSFVHNDDKYEDDNYDDDFEDEFVEKVNSVEVKKEVKSKRPSSANRTRRNKGESSGFTGK